MLVALAAALTIMTQPPHTTALLFHGTPADLARISTAVTTIVRRVPIGRKNDLSASCAHAAPAINGRGLGYRYILCTLASPGSTVFHGSVTFSIEPPRTVVYSGEVCTSAAVCKPILGTWIAAVSPRAGA